MIYQRYVDADLAKVGAGGLAGERLRAAAVCLALVGRRGPAGTRVRGGRDLEASVRSRSAWRVQRFQMPELVTPFSVLGLLREIQHNNGFSAPQMQELAGSIERIERHYFAESDGESVDLHQVAETWIRRAV